MAKIKTAFFCQNCGARYSKWMGQCVSCKQWNTIIEEIIQDSNKKIIGLSDLENKSIALKVQDIDLKDNSRIDLRISPPAMDIIDFSPISGYTNENITI